jgi:hypothetical protein
MACEIRARRAIKAIKNATAQELQKYRAYYRLLGSWMKLRNRNRSLAEYFADHNHSTVAIYGLGSLGICLLEELNNSRIVVRYGIDRNAKHLSYLGLKVVLPESPIEPVDVIVITPINQHEELASGLAGKTAAALVNLEDIIHSL